MHYRITILALIVLVGAAAPDLLAQRNAGRRGVLDLRRGAQDPTGGLGGAQPTTVRPVIPQQFPELRSVKRPLRLMPPRRRIVVPAAQRGDARLSQLADERRRLIGAMRAARSVRDRRAMMTAMSRLESLRQQRLRRMRSVGKSVRPALPATETPETPDGNPVIPLPSLPTPSRR